MTKTLLATLCLLAACAPEAPPWEPSSSGTATPDAGAPPAPTGFTCAPAADGSTRTYPSPFSPNLGMHPGQTFPDFEIGPGYWDLSGTIPSDQMTTRIFNMHDLFCSGYKLALIHVGTRSCPYDREEWLDTTPKLADWAGQGGVVLSVVFEWPGRGQATLGDLSYLEGEYPGNQMVLDPEAVLASAYATDAAPVNVIVLLSSMEVVGLGLGYGGTSDPTVSQFAHDLTVLK